MSDTKDLVFDKNIVEQLSELVPNEDRIYNANPWRKPITLITWGLILTTISLKFLWLQYILPAIGVLLLYLGFRSLRRENKWFKGAYILAVLKIIIQLLVFIRLATPLNNMIENNIWINITGTLLQIVFLLVFRQALLLVYKKVNAKPKRDPLLKAVIWTLIAVICALSPLSNSWIVFIPMVISYVFIIGCIYKVGDELGDVGYSLTNAPVKINNKAFGTIYILICIFTIGICCIAFNHLKLNSTEFDAYDNREVTKKLITLGFPKDILKDMSADELDLLKDANYIEASSEILMFDSANAYNQTVANNSNITDVPGNNNLMATAIFIELDNGDIYAIEHFKWLEGSALWKDGFNLWSSGKIELIKGALLYEKDGTQYISSIPKLENKLTTSLDWFGNVNEGYKVSGSVSYPSKSNKQRGYIFYKLKLPQEQWLGPNCFNYIHFNNPFRFPYADASDNNYESTYRFSEHLKQHYTTFGTKAYREAEK